MTSRGPYDVDDIEGCRLTAAVSDVSVRRTSQLAAAAAAADDEGDAADDNVEGDPDEVETSGPARPSTERDERPQMIPLPLPLSSTPADPQRRVAAPVNHRTAALDVSATSSRRDR